MKTPKGFTLIELMITVAILAILLTVVAPSFRDIVANNRIASNTNNFIDAFAFARSEALGRGAPVIISSADGSTAWGSGLRVWFDADDDGTYDAGEELRVISSFRSTTITGTQSSFTFSASGFVDKVDTFRVCDSRTAETGRSITLAGGGAIRANTNTCA